MPLSGFSESAAKIIERLGQVWVYDEDVATPVWRSVGIVADVKLNSTVRKTRADSRGRTFPLGYDIEVTYVLMQTSYDGELANMSALANPGQSGLDFKLTDRATTAGSVDAAAGIRIDGIIPAPELQLDFNGDESIIDVSMTGRVAMDAFDSFTATGGTLTIDAG